MKPIGIVFALIYFSLGVWFLTTGTTLFEVPKMQQQMLGGVFILYSFYRSYVLYQRYFKYKKKDNRSFTDSYEDNIL